MLPYVVKKIKSKHYLSKKTLARDKNKAKPIPSVMDVNIIGDVIAGSSLNFCIKIGTVKPKNAAKIVLDATAVAKINDTIAF